jgi:hypothetical protein
MDDRQLDEDSWLHRHGLRPVASSLHGVRALLETRTRLERRSQGDGDTELMKLCCVQLFNVGTLDDVLLIWNAKTASFDADCSIDVQLLCGRGLAETKAYLSSRDPSGAQAALRRLLDSEDHGDFDDFSVAKRSAWYDTYYAA